MKKQATDFTGDYTEKDAAVKDLHNKVERLLKLQDVIYAPEMPESSARTL